MQILNSYFNDQKIILTGPFYSTISNRKFRAFHSHNCIEIAYVSSGTAEQIMIFPDGRKETQKLSKGNYIIVDSRAKHAYRNGSDDFTVINLLFKPQFIFESCNSNGNTSSPNVFSITRSEWHDNKEANGIELKIELNHSQTLGDKKYLRLWMDLGGDSEKIDFSEARLGLITNGNIAEPYLTGGSKKLPFYFMSEGDTKWITMHHGENGYFGVDNGSSVKGLKGWFAFPIENMLQEKTGNSLSENDLITGVYFYYSMSEKSMAGKHLYINDVNLVGDYRGAAKNILCDDKILDFNEGILEITISGKDGNTSQEIFPEQIEVSMFEDEELYDLVKKEYPEFEYDRISVQSMNNVYFDKDRFLFSLFKMCHYSSRENWYAWSKMVRHGLSLIVTLSLQSIIEGSNKGKENIVDVVKNYVDMYYGEDITLTEICENNFYNVSYVSRRFKEVANCSFEQYLRQVRMERAGEMLLGTSLSVSEIAERCGYASDRTFRRAFARATGKTPLEFKKKYSK